MRLLLMLAVAALSCGEPPERRALARPAWLDNNTLSIGPLANFTEEHGTTNILVHYDIAGEASVPLDDDDESGVPDYVEAVANTLESSWEFYTSELGFAAPLSDEGFNENGGDGRFDAYLSNFAGSADGAFVADGCLSATPWRCFGHMVMENDFAGYGYPSVEHAVRVVASHELFHAVQASYDYDVEATLSEGSAVWATEAFDPSLDDFEHFIDSYLDKPEQPLTQTTSGALDGFSYGTGLFFQFLSEAYGADVVREVWVYAQEHASEAQWLAHVESALASVDATLEEALTLFVLWNTLLGDDAQAGEGYANAGDYPEVARETVSAAETHTLRQYFASASYFRVQPAAPRTLTVTSAEANTGALPTVQLLVRGETTPQLLELDEHVTLEPGATYDLIVSRPDRDRSAAWKGVVCFGDQPECAPKAPAKSKKKASGCASSDGAAWVGLASLYVLARRRRMSQSAARLAKSSAGVA